MAHDVMIAAAMADKAKAELVAKRLRALKFRVRYDAKREHTTPTTRDLNDANRATMVVVLWSKAACNTETADSDWVHAIAHLARSRKNALFQAGLDATVPDDPFDKDERFKLAGMGPKRIPNGLFALVDALGDRKGRADLSDWLRLESRDTAGRDAWKEAHPDDPIAKSGKPKTPAKKTPASTASKSASKNTPRAEAPAPATPVPEKPAAPPEPVSPPASPPAAPEASGPEAKTEAPAAPVPEKPAPAAADDNGLSSPATRAPAAPRPPVHLRPPQLGRAPSDKGNLTTGWSILGPVMGGIALMLILAWIMGTGQTREPGMPAIGNAQPVYAQTCPPGQVPRSLLEPRVLRTGPIIDDTEEVTPEEE